MIGRVYRHYKGDYYLVKGLAFHSEDRAMLLVIYFSLKKRIYWARPFEMFTEEVFAFDRMMPRFAEVGRVRGWWERVAHWLWKA